MPAYIKKKTTFASRNRAVVGLDWTGSNQPDAYMLFRIPLPYAIESGGGSLWHFGLYKAYIHVLSREMNTSQIKLQIS